MGGFTETGDGRNGLFRGSVDQDPLAVPHILDLILVDVIDDNHPEPGCKHKEKSEEQIDEKRKYNRRVERTADTYDDSKKNLLDGNDDDILHYVPQGRMTYHHLVTGEEQHRGYGCSKGAAHPPDGEFSGIDTLAGDMYERTLDFIIVSK